jgi:competence/damage-inducible protein CinA-like protein
MPSAEILTIGTEILLGEIVDTNSAYLARHLRDLNVDVFRTSTVGDNTGRIAEAIREVLARADILITTGGLGPTVDDPTREAVALAFGLETEYRPELWDQIVERMSRFGRTPTENQKRQAYVPQGATAIHNAVGTAPAFIVEHGEKCVISLPGVPREMEYLCENEVFPYLRRRYNLRGLIKARVLHTAGVGESVIDEQIGDLETLSNPTVGLAAHYGAVDIRITAKADTPEQADALIAGVEASLRQRLGSAIYGADAESLEQTALEALQRRGWSLAIVESNTGGELARRLARPVNPVFLGGQLLPGLVEGGELEEALQAQVNQAQANAGLALTAKPGQGESAVELLLVTPQARERHIRTYGGHPKNIAAWGATSALDLLRRKLGDE